MANYTSADLYQVISAVQPVFKALQFFQYPQNPQQRLYPSVDIKETQPQSPTQTVQLIDYKTKFAVNIYQKWSADRGTDISNLDILEKNIVTAIRGATLTTGKLILETNDFQRSDIQDNPNKVDGVQSVLVLYFVERQATVGIIGLQQTIDIGSISGLQLIGETGNEGRNDTRRSNDTGSTVSNKAPKINTKYWRYMYTKANYDIIQSLIDADNAITVTMHETGQADSAFFGKPVFQRAADSFDQQKTIILQFEVDT